MEPNRNDSQNNKPDGKRPKPSIWVTLLIAVAIVLVVSTIYTAIEIGRAHV